MDKAFNLKDQLHLFRMDAADATKRKSNKDEPNIFVNRSHMQPGSNDLPSVGFSHPAVADNRYNNDNISFGFGAAPQNQSTSSYSSGFAQSDALPRSNAYGNPALHGGDFTNSGLLYSSGNASFGGTSGQRQPQLTQTQTKVNADQEERKRLEAQRQQQKIRQSFQAQRNKPTNPDDLLNKISLEIQPAAKPQRTLAAPKQTTAVAPQIISEREKIAVVPSQFPPVISRSTEISHRRQSGPPAVVAQKPPEINDLMMKFSDLSAAAPSKGFAKPSRTAESTASSKVSASFNDSHSARDWRKIPDDLSSAFSSADSSNPTTLSQPAGSDLPPWCYDGSSLPPEYHLLLGSFRNQAALDKASIMQFLNRSGLSHSTVEHIWTNVCRTKPNYLTRGELCAALSLIGLAQSNFDVHHLTIDVLRRLPNPPVPQFATRSAGVLPHPVFHQAPAEQSIILDSPRPAFQEINLDLSQSYTGKHPPAAAAVDLDDEFSDFVSAPVPVIAPILLKKNSSFSVTTKPTSLFGEPFAITLAASTSSPPENIFAKVTPLVLPSSDAKPKEVISSMPFGWAITDKNPVGNVAPVNPKSGTNSQDEWSNWTEAAASVPVPTATFAKANVLVSAKAAPAERNVTAAELDRYAAFRDLFPVVKTDEATGNLGGMFGDLEEPVPFDAPNLLTTKPAMKASLNSSPGLDTLSLNSLDFGNGFRLNLEGDATPEFVESRASPELATESGDHFSSVEAVSSDVPTEVFVRAIRTCSDLLREAVGVFNNITDSKMVVAVIGKAKSYIHGVIEVYRVGKRIALASKVYGLLHSTELLNVLAEMEEVWADFAVFLTLGAIETSPGSTDFSPCLFGVQRPSVECVCGLCLLNVDGKSRLKGSSTDGVKVEVAGRYYHVSCANFWLNLVSDSLPRLNQTDSFY